ncbi:hypothetical protein FIE12Z_6912 [Fusarium flagelliforme]|uniref:Uncharacterized protein n=1 Tax=Fusarium flagelliforme TaxID=2675880 RepID=A0A395MM49_9HYPO|nr:hypothetical protein FIE12Z_6912 [Fusarium flagelliforme]
MPLEPREFRTVVAVNGTPVSTFITSSTAPQPTAPTDPTNEETTSPSHEPHVGAIVGGVLGGLAIISLGVLGILLYRRKRNKATPPEPTSTLAPYVDPRMDTLSTDGVTTSPIMTELPGVNRSSITKPQGHTVSPLSSDAPHAAYETTHSPPPIYDGPSARVVGMHELDNDRTQHHRGSMQEML